ncbi:MAG: bifunctional riboflavin kinase/FAD synthetase [Spirochaetes bacterium]|nr:bifunctional riboflavin kinase/FAD synthetase [Spirochaetota bacterium]MBN2772318.1 bifunctional riboflavin kinase/FAD synthetase [Spirochaetota bacterium]
MKILDFNSLVKKECVLTTGNFDGVHCGHVKLLTALNDIAQKNFYKRVLLTFKRHPRLFFNPGLTHYVLSPFEEKTKLLSELVDYIVPIDFNKEFAAIEPEDYMLHLIKHFNMQHYIAGYDHHIGRGKNGSFENLIKLTKKLSFKLDRVKPDIYRNKPVSSSRIKDCLEKGKPEHAAIMLGRYYNLEGEVIKGRQLGRTIDFPTANIGLAHDKYIPPKGVYAAIAIIQGKKYPAMLNIGVNPTVTNLGQLSVEAHLPGFSGNIYGKIIKVGLINKIRDEKKFKNIALLKEQIEKDKEEIIKIYYQNILD